MADVVGIVFQSGSKVYYFDPASLELARGEQVVVQTMRGTEIGEVVDSPRVIPDDELPAPLKRVVRKANIKDLELVEANKTLRAEALQVCRDLIAKHELDMKLVDAEIVFGGGKVTSPSTRTRGWTSAAWSPISPRPSRCVSSSGRSVRGRRRD